MKVRIELDPSMDEPEILIRAPRLTQELAQLQESKEKVSSFSLLQGSKRIFSGFGKYSLF